jgi:hypothetical protein
MFFPGSRYAGLSTYTMTLPDGRIVAAVRTPLPSSSALIGFHRRLQGQRLDLIASRYLANPTAFWQLCDANNAMVPDALAAHSLIGIPKTKG